MSQSHPQVTRNLNPVLSIQFQKFYLTSENPVKHEFSSSERIIVKIKKIYIGYWENVMTVHLLLKIMSHPNPEIVYQENKEIWFTVRVDM